MSRLCSYGDTPVARVFSDKSDWSGLRVQALIDTSSAAMLAKLRWVLRTLASAEAHVAGLSEQSAFETTAECVRILPVMRCVFAQSTYSECPPLTSAPASSSSSSSLSSPPLPSLSSQVQRARSRASSKGARSSLKGGGHANLVRSSLPVLRP